MKDHFVGGHRRSIRVRMLGQKTEVHHHARPNEQPEDGQEFALGEEIGFAGLIDAMGDLCHALMNRQGLGLEVLDNTEQGTNGANNDAYHH
ncbi:hypothetical protein SDC9_154506 [bioreactor metagenome]|uniref:Uncharacterized protein n=1 Tax=bioreactor metagenome TaxID=1076179 RepID=A0A645F0G4_9ZZZZ